jgi:mono/diheme cytochrome c family protein
MGKLVQAIPMVAASLLALALSAQQPTDIWGGIYTANQAKRGKEIFAKSCSNCHNQDLKGSVRAPALRGDGFMANWLNSSVNTLYSKLRFSMPATYPETVSDADKLLVLAYLLEVNGFPAGNAELTPTEETLDAMQIVKQGAKDIPNFALVTVTGCLEPKDSRTWTLINASTPAVTREGDSPHSQPLGTKTFVLVSVGAFSPESLTGQKIEARGLLYIEPNENRLNVTALNRLSSSCTAE